MTPEHITKMTDAIIQIFNDFEDSKWIPVSQEPEEWKQYLCITNDSKYYLCSVSIERDWIYFIEPNDYYTIYPTHYRELPLPPSK